MVLGNTLAALSLLSGQSIEYRWLAIILGLLAKNGPLMSAGVFFLFCKCKKHAQGNAKPFAPSPCATFAPCHKK